MSGTKYGSKRKRSSKTMAVPVLGAAGLSLSVAGVASASTGGATGDMPLAQNTAPNHEIIMGEEELSDVSLGTFYVFDKEGSPKLGSDIQLARGCGGRGCGCGGRGCGCGGRGCGGRGCGCARGCGCGGWWGCAGCGCGCCLSWGGCRWC
jgi:hypothetical protein